MKKVLLVGEHPFGSTGNSGYMYSMLEDIDYSQFNVTVFAAETSSIDNANFLNSQIPYKIVPSIEVQEEDSFKRLWGYQGLVETLNAKFDVVIFVGIDVWVYAPIFEYLERARNAYGTMFIAIMPYDLATVREDWVKWIEFFDLAYIYSEFGYNLLKDRCQNVRYFRPRPRMSSLFRPVDLATRANHKKGLIPALKKDALVFGFVGKNQYRKDPQKHIKAFSLFRKTLPINAHFYMHTTMDNGIYNLTQYALDCGLKTGDLVAKAPNVVLSADSLPKVYQSLDVLLNCTMQEGLSWTPIEASLCGTPCIVSDSTAHKDYDFVTTVTCKTHSQLPVITQRGTSWIDTCVCDAEDIFKAMFMFCQKDYWMHKSEQAHIGATKWLSKCNSIMDILNVCVVKQNTPIVRKEKVLFIQKSSAGDVFMTTRCFKGVKERYGLPIDYMTEERYIDVVKNNPYIDEVIPWTERNRNKALREYAFVINVHEEKILPGHWGRNSNSILSDFYWKILKVKPDDFFIHEEYVDIVFPDKPICIVHTTGGDPTYRTYKYMGDICESLKDTYCTVQVGGEKDYPAGAEIDLRGKLSFNQTATVVKKAEIAVTVDSFISHLCGAYGVSQVCLFGSGNANVVHPNQVKGKLICMSPDYINDCPGLGPCSAAVRDCPVKCTSRHNPKDVLANINLLKGEK